MQFGLYDVVDGERRLCGVAAFGVPVSTAVLTKPLPELRPYTEALVCSRFVLLDECPANSESWFLANCLRRLLARGVRGVVSFADPVPRRTASGVLVMPGHVGTIYAATNAVYASRATARTVKLLPDGTVFHDRTAQKIRRQEQGHQYAEAQLIALGAPVPRAGCNRAVWLREVLIAVGARNVRHRGAHRFCGRLPLVAAWPMTLPGRRADWLKLNGGELGAFDAFLILVRPLRSGGTTQVGDGADALVTVLLPPTQPPLRTPRALYQARRSPGTVPRQLDA